MEFIKELFVGGSINDLGTIKYSLSRNIPVQNLYCICLFLDGKNQMQIVASRELCGKRYKDKKFLLCGIAMSKAEARDLLLFIIDTAVKNGRKLTKPEEWIY